MPIGAGSILPHKTPWSYFTLAFGNQGGGTQYPDGGMGALAAGATAADRLAASDVAGGRHMIFGGFLIKTPIATASMNLAIRDAADTTNLFVFTLPVLTLAANPADSDGRPWKLLPEGIFVPNGFGALLTGTATAGEVSILYKIKA